MINQTVNYQYIIALALKFHGTVELVEALLLFGEGNGTPLSTPAWKIPWMEEPGRLQSMGSLRIGHD